MVFGGDGLLGTCVGFKGRLAARAGGDVSRAVAQPERRAPTRAVALRRPALAVGHGFLGHGWPRGAFLDCFSSKADARRLTRASRRGFVHSQLGCSSKRCVCCLKRRCPPRVVLRLSLFAR